MAGKCRYAAPDGMKVCPRCTATLPIDDFGMRKNNGQLRVHSYCKPCRRAVTAAVPPNPERSRANSRAWYQRHRERLLPEWNAKNRAYAIANPVKKREYNRRRWDKGRDRYNARGREQRKLKYWLNVDESRRLGRIKVEIRRARKRAASGTATTEQIQARIQFYGGLCWMCSAPWQELDHVIPLARGGSGWPANLRPACQRCNRSKGAKMPRDLNVKAVR